MIFEFIIQTFLSITMWVLDLVPNIPATPTAVSDVGDWAIEQIIGVGSLFQQILSTPIFAALILITASVFAFEVVYNTVLWVLKKIPMVNLK